MFALACLHFQEQRLRVRGVRGRHRRPLRSRASGRRARCRRDLGRLRACRTARQLPGIDRVRQERRLCDRWRHCLRRELPEPAAASPRVSIAIARSLRCSSATRSRSRGESAAASGQRFDFRFGAYEFRSLEMSLLGAFQFNNAAIAVTLFLLWLRHTRPGAAAAAVEAAVRSGLRDTRWPGRLEVIRQDPLTVIDVGHTPDAIRQSLASLKAIYGAEGWLLVVGVSLDKNAGEIVGALAPSFDTIVCTAAHHKGAEAEKHRRCGAQGQSAGKCSDRRHDRGRRRRQPKARRVAESKNICRRRIVPGDRIRGCRPRRPRAGSEFFLTAAPADNQLRHRQVCRNVPVVKRTPAH